MGEEGGQQANGERSSSSSSSSSSSTTIHLYDLDCCLVQVLGFGFIIVDKADSG